MPFSEESEKIIAAFRGIPSQWVKDKLSVDKDEVFDFVVDKYALDKDTPQQTIEKNWREVMGKHAGRCYPLRMTIDQVFIIFIPSSVLRSELGFQKRTILHRIRSLEGCEDVSGVDFTSSKK